MKSIRKDEYYKEIKYIKCGLTPLTLETSWVTKTAKRSGSR